MFLAILSIKQKKYMDSAISGLLGAGIGAVAGMFGAVLTQSLQLRNDHKKWLLSKKEEAYSSAIRFLLKSLNRRSKMTATGIAVLGQNELPDWFIDLSEAQAWVSSITIYASCETKESINQVAYRFNSVMSELLHYYPTLTIEERQCGITTIEEESLSKFLSFAYEEVLKCAQNDLGKHIHNLKT